MRKLLFISIALVGLASSCKKEWNCTAETKIETSIYNSENSYDYVFEGSREDMKKQEGVVVSSLYDGTMTLTTECK